ncbi:hypothetical protein ElyMa_005286800, partial [Elysia marginata]
KPVLGDVWNTSPSSSEISSYSPWREGLHSGQGHSDGDGCYSREITPSDDGGVGAPGFYDRDKRSARQDSANNPFRSLLNSDEDEDAYREPTAWSLGGEVIATGSARDSRTGDDSLHSYGFSVLGSEAEGQTPTRGQGVNEGRSQEQRQRQILTSVTVEPYRLQASTPAGDASTSRHLQDASTQTDPWEVNYNIDLSDPPPRYVSPLRPGSGGGQRRGYHDNSRPSSGHYLGEHDFIEGGCPSPRPHSPYYQGPGGYNTTWGHGVHSHKNARRMTLGGAGLSPSDPQPTVIDFSPRPLSGDRSRDSPSNPSTPRQPRSKFEHRRRHDLGLDIFSTPRSPTTEIVAKDHGFELAGVEVPYVAGASAAMASSQQGGTGGGSGGGGGGSMFKAPGMQVQGKSFIRPVMSTPATSTPLSSGGFKYKTESSSALSEAVEFGAAVQRPSYRRVHSLSMETDESHAHNPSSARSLPAVPAMATRSGARKGSHNQMRTPHSSRPSSTSPRPRKDRHRSKQSLGGGVDDGGGGGGGGGEDDVMREEDLEDGGSTGRDREGGSSSSSRTRGASSPRSLPMKTLTAPGGLQETEELEFRPIPHGSPVKHPQLRHQREIKESRQQQQHYQNERRDSYHKKKLSSQSFNAGSGSVGLNRRKSERSRSGSSGGGGDKGLRSSPPSIPSHLYHEDEEGYFSSSAAAAHAALNRGVSSGAGQDQHRKGILFFSRLAGAGRHAPDSASKGMRKSGGGGFES